MQLTGLFEDLQDRLRPLRARLFPQQVLLELHDHLLRGQVLGPSGRPGPLTIDAPLPALTCRNGMPLEREPLGDLIGDLLVRDELIEPIVMAALPPGSVVCRVIGWPGGGIPSDPREEILGREAELRLPFALEDATLDLQPLAGERPRMLLAAAPRVMVEAWIQVFNLAGARLERLAPPITCLLDSIEPLLAACGPDELVVVVDPGPENGSVLLLQEGVPVFEKALAEDADPVQGVGRCLAFYRRREPNLGRVRLVLTRPSDFGAALEREVGAAAEDPLQEPFGSLVLQGLATPEEEG